MKNSKNKIFVVSFDLDTKLMEAAGYDKSKISGTYQRDLKAFLIELGFFKHIQGSLYRTEYYSNQENLKASIIEAVREECPEFVLYLKSMELYEFTKISDITPQMKNALTKVTRKKPIKKKGIKSKVIIEKKKETKKSKGL
ncbi:hypothetical protein CH352_00855 [Leptospira hartskeerlii]|uniref:Virulence factor n=1 Tax=Leptospira hartskeerlii TaxID=2023177 RepID=A0A2M9X8C7_9LEPT|nr:hypothetical protein [Leptospira hartskeerlii]PJZ23953.1 hypothetical protein CH357_18435 [Leptospira hartskeerlii]PJZ35217.1 hypothetical protein CH352_00855 [Leptospira hartskeerlii]